MKKKKAIFLAIILTLTMIVPVWGQPTATFRDVPSSHFAFEAVGWVSNPENGAFMVGDAANNFRPNQHINKFEAAQIYAMAAGFRHNINNLPQEERDMFTRSFDTHRAFLEGMATQFSTWNRTVDREIAFLMYRGILTTADVQTFVTRTGTTETRPLLTREEAVVWMVRLVGQAPHAAAVQIHTPFRDDAEIAAPFRNYIYHARELGIIQGAGGYMNPRGQFTRAEMAVVFHNALANQEPPVTSAPTGTPTTISGTITSVFRDTHLSIQSAAGTDTFPIAQNAVIMIDNTQRTPSFLQEGMSVTVLVDAEGRVISLVARSAGAAQVNVPVAGQAALSSDEGFVTAISQVPTAVTIRTQRVRIDGHIIDEERTFSIQQNSVITRGGAEADFADIQVGDIAFFRFAGTVIHELELMERERTILGILADMRPPEVVGQSPVLIIEETDGRAYELRVMPTTEFFRRPAADVQWYDLRIGDAITAAVGFDRLIKVQAVGTRTTAEGRLNEIRITERITEITKTGDDGTTASFFVRPGVFDVYTLRIGMNLTTHLDSREVMGIQIEAAQNQAVLGFIQAVRPDNTIIVVEGTGVTARTHTLAVNNATAITRGGASLNFAALRVNMNVYVVLTAPHSNVAGSITILP
jgi:hypothetical protein